MKYKLDKIIVLFFVLAMFFLMSVSAHAETKTCYFFEPETRLSEIKLENMTITPTNVNGLVTSDSRKIFNEDVSCFARVREDQNNATKFSIETQSKGVLLVYYVRAFAGDEPMVNDGNDLNINGVDGIVEYSEIAIQPNRQSRGVKFFILDVGTYTMTASGYTCGVYGFVYMPGNVAAYDSKEDVSLIGQYSKDSFDNLPILSKTKWRFGGWYKDEAYTMKVNEGDVITEPSIIFARWTRSVWDFEEYSNMTLMNKTLDYDGILIKGSKDGDGSYTTISADNVLKLYSTSTTEKNCVVFTPEYDGEMTVTYASTGSGERRICVIGTDVVNDTNSPSVIAYGESDCLDANPVWKTLQAKMKAGVTYYIFNVNGGIKIDKMQYQASAASAVDDGDNVTLTTTANMQGWRPFYDAYNSYTVDNNTNVYVVVEKDGEDAVKLANRTGGKVPVNCPVILHTNNVQEDGTYLITMTKDATPYEYEGNDNLLSASVTGTPVDAYRLGYRAGEGNGIAFYPWKADTPSAGVVYLDLSNINTAKIAFEIEESTTGVVSIRDNHDKGDNIFNINGQRLEVPQKGFNIINGKKVIVK